MSTNAPYHSRRDFLLRGGAGFGTLALSYLLGGNPLLAALKKSASPLEPRAPHFPAKAQSVIFLFMEGGPSHIDLFDPKPKLNELAGQKIPDSFGKVLTSMGEFHSPLLGSKRQWKQHGQGGLWISENRGDSWRCVSAHLPPIAAVRFVS